MRSWRWTWIQHGWGPHFQTRKIDRYVECIQILVSSNQSILKEINPDYSLEGLMLMLKLLYFGHLMQITDSLGKTLMLGRIKGRRRGQKRMRWLDGIIDFIDMSLSKVQEMVKEREAWCVTVHGVEKSSTQLSDWTTTICHEMMGLDAMTLIFWMLSFKPAFSLSSFTSIKRLFSFSLLSAIRVASSASLKLLIFLPAVYKSKGPTREALLRVLRRNRHFWHLALWLHTSQNCKTINSRCFSPSVWCLVSPHKQLQEGFLLFETRYLPIWYGHTTPHLRCLPHTHPTYDLNYHLI